MLCLAHWWTSWSFTFQAVSGPEGGGGGCQAGEALQGSSLGGRSWVCDLVMSCHLISANTWPLLGAGTLKVSPAEGRALTEGPHPGLRSLVKVLGWGKRVVQGSPPPLLSVTWSRLWLWSQRLSSFLNSQSLAHTSGAIYVNGWRMLPQGLSAFSTSRYLSYSHLKMKAKEVNPLAHGPRPCASCRQIQCSILSINFLSFPWILTTLSLNYSFYHLNNNSIHLKSHVLSAKHCVKCFHPSTRFIFTVSLWERDFYCSRATEEEVGAPAKQCVLEPRSES